MRKQRSKADQEFMNCHCVCLEPSSRTLGESFLIFCLYLQVKKLKIVITEPNPYIVMVDMGSNGEQDGGIRENEIVFLLNLSLYAR